MEILVRNVVAEGINMNWRPVVKIAGVSLMFMITINFYIIVVVAALSGHTVVVNFNHFGEGILEYVEFTLLIEVFCHRFHV